MGIEIFLAYSLRRLHELPNFQNRWDCVTTKQELTNRPDHWATELFALSLRPALMGS